MGREFRGALILSALAHAALFVALLLLASHLSSTRLAFTPAYMVNLVDMPGGSGSGGLTPPQETRQPQAKKPEAPPAPPKLESSPEPRAEKPAPPRPKPKPEVPKPEAPKPEMTLPSPKVKEPTKPEAKKPDPSPRQLPQKKKEVPPTVRPLPDPAGKALASPKREPERPVAGATGGPGAGPGSPLALGTGGGVLSLDTANFPYTYYLRQLTQRIEQNWVRPQENVGRVVVYFRIKRDGTIVEPQLYESSRNQAVDLLAAGAIKRSEPFPPLPVDYGGDFLGIYLCFGVGALCPGQREG
ncbi:MAG: TonB C-terminal domain-containing protein [Nitrospinae bacterium]|nr:TonB C-terminal domain-containing protein [Nitrospinota bacterium]